MRERRRLRIGNESKPLVISSGMADPAVADSHAQPFIHLHIREWNGAVAIFIKRFAYKY